MPKPKIPNQRKAQLEHKKRIERYVALINHLYDKLNKEASKLALATDHDPAKQFLWSDYPQTKVALEKLQSQYISEIQAIIMAGTSAEWKESNLVQDLVANKVLKAYTGSTKSGEEYTRYFETNPASLQAFQQRRAAGMNLSTRVWNLSEQYKTELEMAVSAAIEPGTSAMELAADIKKYLNEPDMMFRRFRYKDENGEWKRKWKQKVMGSDGKVHFIDADPTEYHPGRGLYRSSARNAQRLARTEINMSYRTAEQERWRQFDFVVGYEVKTTQNGHHVEDICDALAGKYPKTFKFMGWHPQCMCYSIPILKTEDEFFDDDTDAKSANEVEDVPQGFKDWIKDNEERIERAEKRGNLPYFIRNNRDEVEYILSHEKASIKAEDSLNRIHENGWNLAVRNQGKTIKLFKDDESGLDETLMQGWGKSPFAKFDAVGLKNELLNEFSKHEEIQEPINFNLFWDRDNNMLRVMIKSQGMDIKRKIYIENGKLIANHEIFDLNKPLQGKGLSKTVLSSFLSKYEAMGVERIELMANYSVGGYAWAKYGFTASKEGPFGVLNVINSSGVSDKFKSEALEIVNRYYSSHKADSRFPMNLLCGKEWSKDMLLGSAWQGELNIGDSDVWRGFKERLKMPQKKRKPQDIAAERHAARTPEDVAKIQKNWNKSRERVLDSEIKAKQTEITIQYSDAIESILKGNELKGKNNKDTLLKYLDALDTLGNGTRIIVKDDKWREFFTPGKIRDSLNNGNYSGSDIRHLLSVIKTDVKDRVSKLSFVSQLKDLHRIKTFDASVLPLEWKKEFLNITTGLSSNLSVIKSMVSSSSVESNLSAHGINMIELSSNKLAQKFGLAKISSKTPIQLFTDFEKAIPGYSDSLKTWRSKEFFDSLKHFIPLKTDLNKGCFFMPEGKFGYVHINPNHTDTFNRLQGDFFKKSILSHEYGHAMFHQYDWANDADIKGVYDKWVRAVNADKGKKLIDAIESKFKSIPASEKGYGHDIYEQLGKMSDSAQAAIAEHPWIDPLGHNEGVNGYFKEYEKQLNEIIAHSSENLWVDNPLFKEIAPGLYNKMRELIAKKLGITI